jgi:hypothetical protein
MPRYIVERDFAEGLRVPLDDAAANTCLAVVPSNLADQVTWVHCAASRSRLPVTRITEVRILDPYFYR